MSSTSNFIGFHLFLPTSSVASVAHGEPQAQPPLPAQRVTLRPGPVPGSSVQVGSTSLGLLQLSTLLPSPTSTSSTTCTGVVLHSNAGALQYAARHTQRCSITTTIRPPQQATTRHFNTIPRWQKGSAGGMPNQPLPMVRCAPSNTLLHTRQYHTTTPPTQQQQDHGNHWHHQVQQFTPRHHYLYSYNSYVSANAPTTRASRASPH